MEIMWSGVFCFLLVVSTANAVPQLDGRIVGGSDVNITSYPYQVSLRRFSSHVCGGSIFHPSYILTAAHCLTGLAKHYSIRVGSTFVDKGGILSPICSFRIHENYSLDTMENDIAILTLCNPLTFNEAALPIALPESSEKVSSGAKATVTGWGYIQESAKSVSINLKQIEIPVVDYKKCQVAYSNEYVTKNMICAGYMAEGGKDACQGDSGGPLMANGKLFGIVSWGYGCAMPKYPGVYTNVASYRNWIKKHIKY